MIAARPGGLRLLMVLLLLAALLLATREALVRSNELERPDFALQFWPPSANAAALLALQRTASADGVVDAQGRVLIAQALQQAPAAGLPLALAGLDASAQEDLARATRLMEQARHRSPRLVLVRAWLINEYARTGRYADALGEAGPVMQLSGESRPQVFALIAAIAARPDGAAAVKAALAAEPNWRKGYLDWRETQGLDAPPGQ